MVVEVANALANREDELDTRVEFACYGSEVVDHMGSRRHAKQTDLRQVKAIGQNDGIARASNLQVYTHGFSELNDVATRIAEQFREPITTMDDVDVSSDTWNFSQHGVPSLLFASERADGTPMYGITARHIFTALDTLDKLDPRDFQRHAIWETQLITEIADERFSVDHKDSEAIKKQLEVHNKDFEEWVFPVV